MFKFFQFLHLSCLVRNLFLSTPLRLVLFQYGLAQMIGAFSQPGRQVSLFIGVKNERPKPNLPKRKGIHPFR